MPKEQQTTEFYVDPFFSLPLWQQAALVLGLVAALNAVFLCAIW